MKTRSITRRQVLIGAGGFSLGLPFLRSLLPQPAYAQDAAFVREPRFFCMTTQHGAVRESSMFPAESMLTETQTVYPGHAIKRGNLVRSVSAGRASVCPALSGPEDQLTAALLAKMNVLRGLDIPFYLGHHTGGYLGNESRNDGNGGDLSIPAMPTIDQLMAWSTTFYPDLSSVKLRSIITGSRGRMSYMWSNASARSGSIEEVRMSTNASDLFREVFVPGEPSEPTAPARPPIVDRVIDNYRSLRQSNRRLSAGDRQRLDDHMDRLAELQRRLTAKPVERATCEDLEEPTAGSDYRSRMTALIDVVVAAFLCGTSRVAVMGLDEANFVANNNDWHQGVAHQYTTDEAQVKLLEAQQKAFEYLFLNLAQKLDVEEADGQTVLDNSLLMWSQESGSDTHQPRCIPVITFGGAAGKLKTGNYCDYRNTAAELTMWGDSMGPTGLLYAQWLATALQSMGLPPSEWQNVANNAAVGYSYSGHWLTDTTPAGDSDIHGNYARVLAEGVVENASAYLPFLKA
jgi:hypothetical protein